MATTSRDRTADDRGGSGPAAAAPAPASVRDGGSASGPPPERDPPASPRPPLRARLATAAAALRGRLGGRRWSRTAIRLLEATLDSAADGLLAVDRMGRVVHFNRTFSAMWGIPASELTSIRDPLDPVMARLRDPDALRGTVETLRREPDRSSFDVLVGLDGRSYEAYSRPQRVGTATVGRVWSFRDVTEQRATEERLRAGEQYFRSLIENALDTITIIDATGRITYESPSLLRVLGYRPEDLLGKNVFDYVHGDDRQAVLRDFEVLLGSPGATHSLELRFLHKDGSWRALEVIGNNLLEDPAVAGVVVNARDITQRKEAENQLLFDAFHDKLTSLPNRALFMDRLTQAMKRVRRGAHPSFAVLYLDLDRFKLINDSLGHTVGDRLLVALARRLERCVRPGDTVARLGGDEFTILLEDISDLRAAEVVADRIHRELETPFEVEGHEVYSTASIGIALSAPTYTQSEELLRDADLAMYRAKACGRARHEVFDSAMHAQAVATLQMETELRHAIDRGMLRLYFQPIVRLEDGRLTGFEALLRWRRPGKGLLTPDGFLHLAEDTGLIVGIGWWVLEAAARAVTSWQTGAEESLFITVNLSAKQLAQPDLVKRVGGILRDTETPGDLLKIEITESAVMEHAEEAVATLQRLRRLGLGLCIDDFGTGYSSLSYLHKFPINTIKVDRSFIGRLGTPGEDGQIVQTILGLANGLGMDVIAEGIETEVQRALLREMGCAYGQGYLFSPPVSARAARRMIRDGISWREGVAPGS